MLQLSNQPFKNDVTTKIIFLEPLPLAIICQSFLLPNFPHVTAQKVTNFSSEIKKLKNAF